MTTESYREEKVAHIRAMFTSIAGKYDFINNILSLWRDDGWRKFAASQVRVQNGGLVLDVATGTAELARCMVRQNGVSSAVGVDICQEMLCKAREKLVNSGEGSKVKLVLADAMELPFADNTFDGVTIGFGLRNVVDINTVFREMRRVVKPGGETGW